MTMPTLIGPVPPSTPSGRGGWRSSRHELPPDLMREAANRLSLTSLVGGALWLIGWTISHLLDVPITHTHDGIAYLKIPDVIAGGVVLASAGLFFYARKSKREPRFILDLGLAYMVGLSLAMGQNFHWAPLPTVHHVTPMISWIGPMMLLFAAVMPTTPGRTLVAGLFAASMNPLGMLIAKARGNWDFGPLSNALVMHYPDYLIVGVAVVVSHVFTRMGEQVSRAREMGSYRLEELLGRGGMGEVYRASHRMLARPAAIKLIRDEILSERNPEQVRVVVERFRREAEAAASLQSPHTVALYDFGITEDRTLYLVMELLDGLDLEALVEREGPLPAARVVHILIQVCESLEEAHRRGLVHRDIKAANIHVGRLGLQYDFVKVLDFGLVKATGAIAGTGTTLQTAANQILGTPAYMPPEMALDRNVDGRADLYSLGCVAYFALTGRMVFEASNLVEMLAKHIHDAPERPSQLSLAPLPPALDELLLTCLAKDPAKRPASAASLAASLAAIDIDPWTDADARAWWERYKPAQPVEALWSTLEGTRGTQGST